MPEPLINVVVALDCEARPLLDRFRLRAASRDGGLRVYEGERLALVVTGVGRIAAAAATGWLASRSARGARRAWLNIGLAGHRSRELGDAILAHKLVDAATGATGYPVFTSRPLASTEVVRTVDRPVNDYPDDSVFDMEAAAFFATATRFAPAELVHVMKVISDNESIPASALDARRGTELVESRIELIDAIISELIERVRELAAIEAPPPAFAALIERCRFSETERHRLRDLLRVASAGHGLGEAELLDAVGDAHRGRDAIERLARRLRELGEPCST